MIMIMATTTKTTGRSQWWASGCHCCCGPRDRRSVKRAERRFWQREAGLRAQ